MQTALFRISPAAAEFIREHWQRDASRLVVAIQAEVAEVGVVDEASLPISEILELGRKHFESLPDILQLRWRLGAANRSRFQDSDIHVIDGIAFHLPRELVTLVAGRELILSNASLRFEPDLDPLIVRRSKLLPP